MTDNETAKPTTSEAAELTAALRRHVWALSGRIGERSVSRGAGLDQAERYLIQAFETAGLRVVRQPYRYRGRTVANLVADLGDASWDRPMIVVGAHYDTVTGTPGADDNASAVAVMLELAGRIAAKSPNTCVRFVAFTAEEPPAFNTEHQGSRVFVRRLRQAGDTVAGAIILEMVGVTSALQRYPPFLRWLGYPKSGDFIGVVGNRSSRTFGERVLRSMRRNAALPVESLFVWFDGWLLPDTRLSDHASFWDAGIPALMVTDTAYFRNPHYHGPGDRPETLDYAFMAALVRSLELALGDLSAAR